MKLYIMRHGETDWNKQGILQGSTDITLNACGIQMAEITGVGLKKDNIVFDRIFSSPYLRAKTTAEIIARDLGCEITIAPQLREMCFGKYEGHKISEFRTNPEYTEINKFFYDPAHYRSEGNAENFEEVFTRIQDFLAESILPLEDTCENVLIVCHTAIIRAFICLINKMSLEDYWSIYLPNCSVSLAKVENGQITMAEENHVYYECYKNARNRFV